VAAVGNGEPSRRAVVYPVVNSDPKMWRIRVELIPDDKPGWFGGRVLWGHDKPTEGEANELAYAWVKHGDLPLGYDVEG
jgi:hypothetical protein